MTTTISDAAEAPPSSGAASPPACPQCKRPMRIRVVEPLMFARDVDDTTYRCEECGTEAKRAVKRR